MKLAVYGSLKEGFYNHDRLLAGLKPIARSTIDGAMFLVQKSYPFLVEQSIMLDKSNPHMVEIYEVDDEVYDLIYWMEVGSGYYAKVLPFTSTEEPMDTILATIYFTKEMYVDERTPWIAEYSGKTAPEALA